MKVMYIRNGPYKANLKGYNDQGLGLAKALMRKGISCDLVNYSHRNKVEVIYEEGDIEIRSIEVKGLKMFRTGLYPQILNKKFLNTYDLIITTEYSQIMTLFLSKLKKEVILYSGPYYNLFKIKAVSSIYDFLFTKSINKNIDYKFVKSNLAKNYLEGKGYSSVYTLGVGNDIGRFNELDIKCDIKTKEIVGKMKKNKYLLFVGSIDDRKNFPFLIKLFEKFFMDHADYKLLIIGSGNKRYIHRELSKVNLETQKNIEFVGKIDNTQLKFIYPEAEIFLLPSKQEIFGMVLLEAMSFGVPVISSKNGGSSTLIKNNVNGIVVEDFNIDTWNRALENLIIDRDLRKRMSENAKKRINEHFTWDKIVDKACRVMKNAEKK